MKMSTLLAFIAVFTGSVAATVPAYAADKSCHLPPVADSTTHLQHAQTVGVLYSENTLNTLQYLEQYHAVAVNGAKTLNWIRASATPSSTVPTRSLRSTG